MKPNATPTLYRNDVVAETVAMSIDESSLQHIMSVLTDLYSDPTLAIIREYSTNALDSHIEAGQTRPIEVTLPTDSHRKFIVRDFGVGLSVDDIRRIYSAYGASTKRESDSVTGMLGLGSKSGLTYTNTFTVESVKNGVKVIAVVTKDQANVGSIKILDTFTTDESNGVTITVPVKEGWHEVQHFQAKAKHFFSFWREGVLIDGEPPEPVSGFQIDPDVILTNNYTTSYVVMGNVPYPVETHNEQAWVAWVNMGDVDFVPSREALHMTSCTTEALGMIKDFISTRTDQVAQAYLAEAESGWDRARRYREITAHTRHRSGMARHFKNLTIPDERSVWKLRIEKNGEGSSHAYGGFGIFPLIDEVMGGTTIIKNFPFKRVSPKHRRQLFNLDPDQRNFVILPDEMDLLHYNGMPATEWADVPEVEREKSSNGRVKANVEYTVYVGGGCIGVDQNLLDEKNEDDCDLLYLTIDDRGAREISRALPGTWVVSIQERQRDKLCRLYPHAKNAEGVLRKAIDKVFKQFDDRDKEWMSRSSSEEAFIDRLRNAETAAATPITDPDIRALIDDIHVVDQAKLDAAKKLLDVDVIPHASLDLNESAIQFIRYGGRRSGGYYSKAPLQWITERYPLLDHVTYWNASQVGADIVEYINDRYEKYHA